MLFMVIEKFKGGNARAVYERFRERGRQMPEGVKFISSHVTADCTVCFQVMECGEVSMLQRWVSAWSDLVEFTIYPVTTGQETAAAVMGE